MTPDQPAEWFATLMLGAHLDRLPPGHHDAFVQAILAELEPPFTARYVRLNIDARR